MSGVENHVVNLEHRHSELEKKITAEELRPHPDSDVITRLKLEKLHLKEELEKFKQHA